MPPRKSKLSSSAIKAKKKSARNDAPGGARVLKFVPRTPAKAKPKVPDLYQRVHRGEVTTETALLEVALALDLQAKRSAAPADIAAARVLDALWLATRRRDDKRLARWNRDAFAFLQTRTEAERWKWSELPPQAGVDRSDAITTLLLETKKLLASSVKRRKPIDALLVGIVMDNLVACLFPSLRPNPLAVAQADARRKKIADHYTQEFNAARGKGRFFDDCEQLAAGTLQAFGVKAGVAWNWIKGAKISVIEGGGANDQDQTAPTKSRRRPPAD